MLEERITSKKPVTWQEIKIEVINCLTPKESYADVITKLKQLQQKDSVESYAKEFVKIASSIVKPETEDLLIELYKNGIKPEIRKAIEEMEKQSFLLFTEISQTKLTLDNYLNISIDYEKKNKINLESYCTFCRKHGHNIEICWSKEKKQKNKYIEKETNITYEKNYNKEKF